MTTHEIVALITAERDKLNAAIAALSGEQKRRGRPLGSGKKRVVGNVIEPISTTADDGSLSSTPVPRKRKLSAAGRAAIVAAAKKRWAAIKAGKALAPFAKRVGGRTGTKRSSK